MGKRSVIHEVLLLYRKKTPVKPDFTGYSTSKLFTDDNSLV